jgi:hypothetical protein
MVVKVLRRTKGAKYATGLGVLGLLGWRRKRKARVSLLGAA